LQRFRNHCYPILRPFAVANDENIRFDGAPEPTYNRGLEDFDVSVTSYFAQSGGGQVVLVETFGGKRHYYFYVSPSVKVESVLSDLRGRFPGYKLEAEVRNDPGWTFIRRYIEEYLGEA
jgi:hypothetical protein